MTCHGCHIDLDNTNIGGALVDEIGDGATWYYCIDCTKILIEVKSEQDKWVECHRCHRPTLIDSDKIVTEALQNIGSGRLDEAKLRQRQAIVCDRCYKELVNGN